MAVKHNRAHEVKKGDPRIDGPYLDDIRRQQEELGREARAKARGKNNAALVNTRDTVVLPEDKIVKKAAAPKPVKSTKVPSSPPVAKKTATKKTATKKTATKKAAVGKKSKDAK